MAKRKKLEFTIHTLYSEDNGGPKMLIIAHQDLDGVCSAGLLIATLKGKYSRIDVVFTQPYHSGYLSDHIVGKGWVSNYDEFSILDVSVDAVNPLHTVKLFNTLKSKLKYIFDHHNGWDTIYKKLDTSKFFVKVNDEVTQDGDGNQFIIVSDDCACAKVIYDFFGFRDKYMTDLVRIGIISDDLSIRSEMYESDVYEIFTRLKSMPLIAALKEIINKDDVQNFNTPQFNWVEENSRRAKKLIDEAVELAPGIGYLRCFEDLNVDFSSLYELAYQKYNIFIIKELNTKKYRANYIVAHNNVSDLDLTKVFNLQAGSPRRVTLCKGRFVRIADILGKLKQHYSC